MKTHQQKFLFKIGPGESALRFGENEKAEYLGEHPERSLEMLKVSISIKSIRLILIDFELNYLLKITNLSITR